MGNLFSIFDPAAVGGLPLNWVACLLGLTLLPSPLWISSSQSLLIFRQIRTYLNSEIRSVLGSLSTPGILWRILSFLFFILLNNVMGLFPYIFTAPRHLLFTLPLGLTLWLGFTLTYRVKRPLSILAHFVPLGTPYPLIPFIVVIEIISNIIRPLTLSVRLAANIVAGHLLLTLLRSLTPSGSWRVLVLAGRRLILLLILESAVAVIQAYVFRVLTSLYVEEVEAFEINLSKLYPYPQLFSPFTFCITVLRNFKLLFFNENISSFFFFSLLQDETSDRTRNDTFSQISLFLGTRYVKHIPIIVLTLSGSAERGSLNNNFSCLKI